MTLADHMAALVAYYQDELAAMPWPSEHARWGELAFCLIERCSDDASAVDARRAIEVLQYLGLLEVDRLAAVESEPASKDGAAIETILRSHRYSEPDARSAVRMLADAARMLSRDFEGRLQIFLFNEGMAIFEDLARLLAGSALDERRVRYAVAMWLQNALNLPVAVEHPAVVRLCERYGASMEDVARAADDLDLNLAVVDDLVALGDGDENFEAWLATAHRREGEAAARTGEAG